MTLKTLSSGRAMTMPGGIVLGAGLSLSITLALCWILAELLSREVIAIQNIGYWIMGVLLISSFFGAWMTKCRVKYRLLVVCLVTGVVYFSALALIPLLFFGGDYGSIWETALLILGGSILPALLSKGKNEPISRKKGRSFKLGSVHNKQKL